MGFLGRKYQADIDMFKVEGNVHSEVKDRLTKLESMSESVANSLVAHSRGKNPSSMVCIPVIEVRDMINKLRSGIK